MAAVYGPGDVKPNKALMDKATVTVTYKPKIGISGKDECQNSDISLDDQYTVNIVCLSFILKKVMKKKLFGTRYI